MSPCRRPHRTNCCASAVPTIYPTLPSKPGPRPVGTEDDARFPPPRRQSDLHVRYPENRADRRGPAPGVRRRLADRRRRRRRAGRRRRRHPDAAARAVRHASYGCRATTSCGPGRRSGVALRGEERYRHLVQACRAAGVLTPEDPFPVWTGDGRARGRRAAVPALRLLVPARRHRDRRGGPGGRLHAPAWCAPTSTCSRPTRTPTAPRGAPRASRTPGRRLDACDPDLPTVLVNHWPLTRLPTRVLRYPEFALWCGTTAHRRLARPLPRHRGRLRPPAHPARDLGGRGAVRRGVAGLPARVAGPGRPGSAPADGAAGAALSPVQ